MNESFSSMITQKISNVTKRRSSAAQQKPAAAIVKADDSDTDNEDEDLTNSEDDDDDDAVRVPRATTTSRALTEEEKKEFASICTTVQELWDEDGSEVEDALSTLAEFCEEGDHRKRNSRYIGRVGGPMSIVQAMKRHEEVDAVQAEGIGAIMNLSAEKQIAAILVEVGALEHVIAVMKKYPDQKDVQDWGCVSLENMAAPSQENRIRIAKGGGIDVVLGAMKTFPDDSAVHRSACEAISDLAAHGGVEVVATIVSAGGLTTLSQTLEKHISNATVRKAASDALGKLSMGIHGVK